jgi:catechol 2,3-dioxygenase-like lactoylglutathione lyase family enzyme
MPELSGFSHIALTVTNCDETAQWWQDVLGFVLVNRVEEATFRCRSQIHASGIAVTVMTHDATAGYGPTLVFRDPDNTQLELYVHPNLDDMSLTDADSDAAREALRAVQ